MNFKAAYERLFLSKGVGQNGDVYVDTPVLPQHQINALRFIYKQYIKKNPGIIVNDPKGYGKTVEVVLFVKAMKHLLKQPVLIICNEEQVDVWLKNFQKWTDLMAEIAVNPSNPYIKGKKVLIATWSEFVAFHVRNWSVMVVHHDQPKKELFKYSFNADFKMWVSSDDMMEDLDSFITIYEWLHPKGDINLLRHDGTNLEKQIHRDAFMKDIVIRGRGFDSPEITIQKTKTSSEQIKTNRKTKNKDATGTKIKRSRKNDNEFNITSEVTTIKVEAVDSNENKDLTTPRSGPRESNLNLKSKSELGSKVPESSGPIKRTKLGQSREKNICDAEYISIDCVPVTKVKEEIFEEVSIENTEPVKSVAFRNQIIADHDKYKDANIKTEDSENISSQNITLHYTENDSNCVDKNVPMDVDLDTESKSLLSCNEKTTNVTNSNEKHSDNEHRVNEINILVNNDKDLTDNIDNMNYDNDSNINYDNNKDNIIKSADNHVKESTDDVEMCPEASEKTTDSKKLVNKSFDSVLEEMEQKALKKFQGSFLDSLF
ncbi:hypothetical protein K1T71_007012 [Dendrolimus kikuchii]|uniref:Uncharacterized protein n=1 Tax=Dendrolimus kikuchii TaxID=765133 RepID=A0ACC1CZD4_9NEOP|nr:hypothetical protein K1T71_007012 [Dendrolimus kikuchii]